MKISTIKYLMNLLYKSIYFSNKFVLPQIKIKKIIKAHISPNQFATPQIKIKKLIIHVVSL